MDDKDVQVLREISGETGVNGVPRLVALFQRRYPELAAPYSGKELSELAKKSAGDQGGQAALEVP